MIWVPGSPVVGGKQIFVAPSDLEELVVELTCAPTIRPSDVIVVQPHVAAHWAFARVVAEAEDLQATAAARPLDLKRINEHLGMFHADMHEVVVAVVILVNRLNQSDADGSITAAHHLQAIVAAKAVTPVMKASTSKLLNWIVELADLGIRPMSWPSIFEHNTPDPANKKWWKWPHTLSPALTRLSNRLSATFGTTPPTNVIKVKSWVDGLASAFDELTLDVARPESDCFRAASAFFAAAVDRLLRNGHPILALIAIHRAWEWFMCSRCADQNLLDFSWKKLRIRHDGKDCGFDSLRTESRRMGHTFAGVHTDLDTLNEWRNMLAYTHGLSAPPEMEVARLAATLVPAIRNSSNNYWRRLYSTFSANCPITTSALLDPDDMFHQGMKAASAVELDPATYGLT